MNRATIGHGVARTAFRSGLALACLFVLWGSSRGGAQERSKFARGEGAGAGARPVGQPGASRPAAQPRPAPQQPAPTNPAAGARPQEPARPAREHPTARPNLSQLQRPAPGGNPPGFGGGLGQPAQRPAVEQPAQPGNAARPLRPGPTRPDLEQLRPPVSGTNQLPGGIGSRPGSGLTRPGTRPGEGIRPTPQPTPGGGQPPTQPTTNPPIVNRPGAQRPGLGSLRPGRPPPDGVAQPAKPGPGGVNLNPNPTTTLPEIVNRPGRPLRPGRPVVDTGTTPGLGVGRPIEPGRPGVRPNPPEGGTLPTRPRPEPQPGVGQPNPGQPGIAAGGGNRPGFNRPGFNRPGGDRPIGQRPGGDQRPDVMRPLPDVVVDQRPHQRPSLGHLPSPNRPTTRPTPDQRPGFRPGRPGIAQRPGPGGQQNNVQINNVVVNNQTVNNIHNHQQVVNNFNRPGGWWGNGPNRPHPAHWGDYWYDQHVHQHHHGWYHGAWGGHWTSAWTAPFALGVLGWGSSNFLYNSGYVQYVNPYATPVVIVQGIDYSRPIVIQQVTQPVQVVNEGGKFGVGTPTAVPVELEPGLQELDEARTAFRAGQYVQARVLTERALQLRPGDPAAHEFYALCLFALGEYQPAAMVLNAFLASSPGWDWTTMSSLYDSPASYERQLRALEQAAVREPGDVSRQFVLAYHYLVCGHGEPALQALRRVRELQPQDTVAAKLVATLERAKLTPAEAEVVPEEERLADAGAPQLPLPDDTGSETAPTPGLTDEAERPDASTDDDPADDFFDLVGVWVTSLPQGGTVTLSISEESHFVWRVEPAQGDAREIQGTLSSDGDQLILESPEQGTMAGRAIIRGPGEFSFLLNGGPADDPGLTFQKQDDDEDDEDE